MRRIVFKLLLAGALLLAGRTRGADVSLFGILKSQQFLQTNNGSPFLPPTNAYVFDSFVFPSTNGTVTNATVTPPASVTHTLLPDTLNVGLLFEQRFDTSSALDLAYPTGSLFSPANYTVTTFGSNDGMHAVTLDFASSTYSATPQIADFDAAQTVDTTTAFTFTWILAGGQGSDLVQLTVEDAASNTIFATPFPSNPGALTGLSNAATVPASVLPPGTNLIAHLSVGKAVGLNTNSYPGATGVSILGKDIQFPVVTRPAPLAPRITTTSGRTFPVHLQFTAETNRNYHLQSSSNLSPWTDLLVTNLASGSNVSFTDLASTNSGRRFYRVQVGP